MGTSQDEIFDRLLEVEGWLRDECIPDSHAARRAGQKWGIGYGQGRSYVGRVYQRWNKERKGRSAETRHSHRVSQLERILQLAHAKGDYRTAIMAVDRLCLLEGLTEGNKVAIQVNTQINGDGGQETRTLTTAERNNRIDVLIAERARLKGLNGHGGGNGVDRAGAIPARCSEGDEESGGGDE